jgi:hypothetical protein
MTRWRRALRAIVSLTILVSMFPWLVGTAQNGDANQKTHDLAARGRARSAQAREGGSSSKSRRGRGANIEPST